MQSSVNLTDQNAPVPPGDNHDRLSDTYVIRKTVDADNTEEHCYFCFEDWQIGDGMVRLRCCDHWLHEDCLSKSVLDGRCPTCGIWLASLDDAQVLAGAASTGDVLKVRELLEKHTPCIAQDYYGRTPLHLAVLDGHEEVVKELLDCGVDSSTTDFKAQTALHLAAQRYSLGVLRLLLERGADMAEVGMMQRPMMSSSRFPMQEMGTQLGIVGQNRVEGMETGPQEWEWLTMSL